MNVTSEEESSTRSREYAVEAGGTVYGIRQDLAPDDEIRLGMPVTLVVDGTAAVIEWGDSGTYRWKMLKTPPAPGIVDDLDGNGNRGAMKRIRRGTAVSVTLLGVLGAEGRPRPRGGGGCARCGRSRTAGSRIEATIPAMQQVPGYAAHLPVIGATLPGWIRSGLAGRRVARDRLGSRRERRPRGRDGRRRRCRGGAGCWGNWPAVRGDGGAGASGGR